ncbi:hypothetical protein ANCDUO_17837, partial [Ancylostoma duodenale]
EAQGDKQKETIRAKCTTYLNRYEQIKKFLKEGKDKKPVKGYGFSLPMLMLCCRKRLTSQIIYNRNHPTLL